MGVGLILVAVGVVWLLSALGVPVAPYLWPVILIVLGAWMIVSHLRYGPRGWSRTWRMRW
jgi:hypothetical protein